MSWLSLAANRFRIKKILQENQEGEQDLRTATISAGIGRYAMLSADKSFINGEIEIAETILNKYKQETRPPNPYVLSDVFDLAIIASLGKSDYFEVLKSIAETNIYQEKEEKMLQLVARRIVGTEPIPEKQYKKRGHIKKESEWLKIIKDIRPSDAFDLAVTIEHPESYLLEKFILPLAYLLAKAGKGEDWRDYFRALVSWGASNFEKRDSIVYERNNSEPEEIVAAVLDDKTTWRGFDAVELRQDEVLAYYYLGTKWEAPLFFQEELNAYSFFDGVDFDWKLVEQSVDSAIWKDISEKLDEKKCSYIVAYDSANASVPEAALQRATEYYGLKIIPKDITEV